MLCIILLYNYSIAGFNSPSRSDILMLLGLNSIFVPPIWYIFILNMMLQYLLELFLIHHKCKSFLPWQSVWCCSIIIWQETCYAAGSLLTSCHSTANSSQGSLKNPTHKCSKVHKPQAVFKMQIQQFVYKYHNIHFFSDENCEFFQIHHLWISISI